VPVVAVYGYAYAAVGYPAYPAYYTKKKKKLIIGDKHYKNIYI
jgi:hypothetical protein